MESCHLWIIRRSQCFLSNSSVIYFVSSCLCTGWDLQWNCEQKWQGWTSSPCPRECVGCHHSVSFRRRTLFWFWLCGVLFFWMLFIKEGVCFCFSFAKSFSFNIISVEFCRALSLHLLKWTYCPLVLVNITETLNSKLLYIPGIIVGRHYPFL